MIAVWFVVFSTASVSAQVKEDDLDFFEKRVRPILAERCAQCHLRTDEPVEGGFSIHSLDAMIAGGDTGSALVVGQPEKSLMIDAINYRGLYEMPPDSKLPAEEIKILEDWVRRGAPWPDHLSNGQKIESSFNLEQRRQQHWAWQPIEKPAIPAVEDTDWPLDPIDNFILARLQQNNLKPAEKADRRTWIRRVYLDLIGLPPNPQAVRDFFEDNSDNAYEKVVDQLLASPQFGEHWARHWMDLVRYAETYGHEFDFSIEHAYQYRDYLIRAFNSDVRFDEFIREHIAGDLQPNPRTNPEEKFNESIIGSGFWFFGEATHGPVDVKDDEARRIDNQIDVMCKTFLGVTVACARCHDHKFDAISADDYYALSGFLQSSRRQLAMLDPHLKIESAFAEISKARESKNELVPRFLQKLSKVKTEQWLDAIKANENQQTSNDADSSASPVDFKSLLQDSSLKNQLKDQGHPLHLLPSAAGKEDWLLKFRIAEMDKAWALQQKKHNEFIANSELFEDFNDGIPQDWFATPWAFKEQESDNCFSCAGNSIGESGIVSSGLASPKLQGVLRSPTFEITHDKIAFLAKGTRCQIRLIIDGYIMHLHNPLLFTGCHNDVSQPDQFSWVVLDADVKNYKGHTCYIEIVDDGDSFIQIDEIRMVDDGVEIIGPPSDLARNIIIRKPANRVELQNAIAESLTNFFQFDRTLSVEQCRIASLFAQHSELGRPLAEARNELTSIEIPEPMMAIAMADGTPENEHLFIRGNHKTIGPEIERRFLTACQSNGSNNEFADVKGSGRLELANQIASPNNPLTSRVITNRIWHHLIGQGIVASVDNFGALGNRPTHPQLLDYLATNFIDYDWSVKRLIRRIVLSQTYGMASENSVESEKADPDNQWIHRANIKRLSGEAIRDSILQVAQSLNSEMFGPSVQPDITDFMEGRGRPRAGGPIDGNGRRSIYIAVRRNFLSPMMLAFDTPIPFNTVGKRHQSNVPTQALILMNDPFVVEQAKKWAERIIAKPDDRDQRIELMFQRAFGRPTTPPEMESAKEFLLQQAKERNVVEDQMGNYSEIWADLCHVIFNMKEFIYIK